MNNKIEIGDMIIDKDRDKYLILGTLHYPMKYRIANISKSFVSDVIYESLDVIIKDYFGSDEGLKIIKTYNDLFR